MSSSLMRKFPLFFQSDHNPVPSHLKSRFTVCVQIPLNQPQNSVTVTKYRAHQFRTENTSLFKQGMTLRVFSAWPGSITWEGLTWHKNVIAEGTDCILRFSVLWVLCKRLPLSCHWVVTLCVGQIEPAHPLTAPHHHDDLWESCRPAENMRKN